MQSLGGGGSGGALPQTSGKNAVCFTYPCKNAVCFTYPCKNAVCFTYPSALRKWVQRFAREGTGGLLDRPRSGRPLKMIGELETQLNRLVDQDPLKHGSIHSQWSCRELAGVLSQQSGVPIGRESVRLA